MVLRVLSSAIYEALLGEYNCVSSYHSLSNLKGLFFPLGEELSQGGVILILVWVWLHSLLDRPWIWLYQHVPEFTQYTYSATQC